jgi:predicted dehydrogenase
MDKIRLGFLGCGKIAQIRHIPEAARREDVTIVGYYNRSPHKAEKMAEAFGGKVYDSADALLKDPDIDAVVISAANHLHKEFTVEALKNGKHVLCEKPMAMTFEDSKAMVKASETYGKILDIAHNQRLNKAHQKARQLIKEGEIGKVLSFRSTFGHGGPEGWSSSPGKDVWFFKKDMAGMGAMADLGIHKTDLLQYLMGEKIVEVSAMMGTLDKKDETDRLITVDDNAVCLFKSEKGALGTMTVSWTYYGPEDNSTRIFGTEGVLYIYEDPEHPLKLVRKDQSVEYFEVDEMQTNENQTVSGVMDSFIHDVKSGQSHVLSAKEILYSMQVVFACGEAFKTGKTVHVEKMGGSYE